GVIASGGGGLLDGEAQVEAGQDAGGILIGTALDGGSAPGRCRGREGERAQQQRGREQDGERGRAQAAPQGRSGLFIVWLRSGRGFIPARPRADKAHEGEAARTEASSAGAARR